MNQDTENTQSATSETQTNVDNTAVANDAIIEPAIESLPAEDATSTNNGGEKKNQWMPIALIICVILAIVGVGFGIWAVTRAGGLDGEIASLKSQNSELKAQLDSSSGERTWVYVDEESTKDEGVRWSSVEVRGGVFYVLDGDGQVIVQSNPNGPEVNELLDCSSSSNDTVLECAVSTSEGIGSFTYDIYSDFLTSSFDDEETS